MISSKDDYRFITQDALKYISIKGQPYPSRKEKRVSLGEDWAILKEAVQERVSMLSASLLDLYDTAIHVVDRIIDFTFYSAVQESLKSSFYYEKYFNLMAYASAAGEKIFSNKWTSKRSSDPSGEDTTQAETDARRNWQDTLSEGTKLVNRYRNAYQEKLKELEKEKEEALENAQLREEARLSSEYTRNETELENITAEYKKKVQEENDKHAANKNELYSKLAEEKDPNKKLQIEQDIEKEDARHDSEYETLDVSYHLELHKEDNIHNSNLSVITKEYEEEVDDIEDNFDTQNEKALKDRDDAIEKVNDSILTNCESYSSEFGYWDRTALEFRKVTEYLESKDYATITKLCADKWFTRPMKHKMSSTVLNRVFADLERMIIAPAQGTFFRMPHSSPTATYPYYYEEWINPADVTNYLYQKNASLTFNPSNTDFGIYIGTRQNSDTIKKVYVDVLASRYETVEKEREREKRPFLEWKAKTAYSEGDIVEFHGDVPQYKGSIVYDRVEWYFEITEDHTSGDYPGTVEDGPFHGQVVSRDYYYNTDEYAYSYYIQRIEMHKELSGSSMIDNLDICDDKYYANKEAIVEEYDELLKEEVERYENELEKLQAAYDKDVEKEKAIKESKYKEAQKQYVNDANSPSVNESIREASTDDEKKELLDRWEDTTLNPAITKRNAAEKKADNDYNDKVAELYNSFTTQKNELYEDHRAKYKAIEKDKSDALKELEGKRDEEGKYISGWRKERADIIETYQTQPVEDAKEDYDNAVNAASTTLVSKNANAMEKFKNAVTGHIPSGWEEALPLDDYQKSQLEGNQLKIYLAAENDWTNTVSGNWADYHAEVDNAKSKRYSALSAIPRSDQEHRDRWVCSISPLGGDILTPGDGLEETHLFQVIEVLGVYTVFEPRTLTGEDFTEYYDELEEEEVDA